MIEAQEMEAIRSIISEQFDKIMGELKNVVSKIDVISDKHHEISERQVRQETIIDACDKSRVDHGRRLGDFDREIAVLKAEIDARRSTKKESAEWVKWAIPIGLTFASLVIGYIVGKL